MTDVSAFGELKEEFSNMSEGRKNATFVLIFVCFGLAIFLFLLVPTIEDWFNYILFIVSGCFAILGGVGCIQSFRRNRDVKIQRYENGVVVNQNGVVNSALWSEIKSVREEASEAEVNIAFQTFKSGERFYYTIEKKNGEAFRFFMTDQVLNTFGLFLRMKTVEFLLPEMRKDFEEGKTVEFGKEFKINKTALTRKGESVRLSEIQEVIVESGLINVIKRDGKSAFGLILSGDVPNAHLLKPFCENVFRR